MLKLHNYQKTSKGHIIANSFAGLFLDMGLGKTVSTLTAIYELIYERVEVSRVLVIAPKRVAQNVWSEEVAKWPHLDGLRVSKVIGTERHRREALAADADIYLLGRDNVAWLCGQYGGSMLPFDMLVIDESSSFKNPNSIRFKALKKVQPSFNRVVLLTGTPAPNSLMDLWPQVYLLDRGERLGRTIGEYRRTHFTPGAQNGGIIYNYKVLKHSEQKIQDSISDICISMKAEDYLDLPGAVEKTINVEFSDKLQKQYADFEREQVLQLIEGGEEIGAMSAAALAGKLQQFANGAIYDDDKNVHEVHDLKLEALEQVIEEAQGRPVLVAYSYKHDLWRMQERLKKYNPVKLDSPQHIADWNAGKIRVLMMHPASGGHGLNLQKGGNIVVWFGLTWSLELLQQFNARLNRQGQESVVSLIRLAALSTIDKRIIASNERKATAQDGLMAAVKALIKEYENKF